MQALLSTSWWLGAALAGLAFSFIVPLAKSRIDRWRGGSGSAADWHDDVTAIRASSVRQALQAGRIGHHYGRSAFFMVVSTLIFFCSGYLSLKGFNLGLLFGPFGLVLALFAVQEFRYGKVSYEQLKAAGEK